MVQTGLIGSEQALHNALAGSLSVLGGGINTARGDLTPYTTTGAGATGIQAALAGALGPEAQAQAYQNFQASPGQQYLQQQAERAITRNAAATGGRQGGNVLQELQRNAIGLAQQDFGNQFNRLSQVAGQGLTAAGQAANLAAQGGQAASNLAFQTGQSLAGGRQRAGEQIAGNVSGTTSALADLINQQGSGIANVLGGAQNNIVNLLQGAGAAQGQSSQNLATILANIATQQGSQAASLPGIPGVQQTPGILGGLGSLAGGLGGLLSAL